MREEALTAMTVAVGRKIWLWAPDEPNEATGWEAEAEAMEVARDALDALLVFLTEHADEWAAAYPYTKSGFWGNVGEGVVAKTIPNLLAVLSADREDADGVSRTIGDEG